MKFTIDRKTWLRGEGSAKSWLLRKSDNKMCCMGSVCLQMGIPARELEGVRSVSNLLNKSELDELRTAWVGECYATNDDDLSTDANKEKRLKQIFAANGHELEFIN